MAGEKGDPLTDQGGTAGGTAGLGRRSDRGNASVRVVLFSLDSRAGGRALVRGGRTLVAPGALDIAVGLHGGELLRLLRLLERRWILAGLVTVSFLRERLAVPGEVAADAGTLETDPVGDDVEGLTGQPVREGVFVLLAEG